ncbi:hypothetical protein BH10ACT8_BH10ACT8_23100 [soil metagenome]
MDFGVRPWFAVRCIFSIDLAENPAGTTTYEERITLWRASSAKEAIQLAEEEAVLYANELEVPRHLYLGFAQSFNLFEDAGHASEVFSLMRNSTLAPDEYLTKFFDTGSERLRNIAE